MNLQRRTQAQRDGVTWVRCRVGGGSSRAGMKLKVGPQGLFSVTVKRGVLLASEAQPRSGWREWGFALIPVPSLCGCRNCGLGSQAAPPWGG